MKVQFYDLKLRRLDSSKEIAKIFLFQNMGGPLTSHFFSLKSTKGNSEL